MEEEDVFEDDPSQPQVKKLKPSPIVPLPPPTIAKPKQKPPKSKSATATTPRKDGGKASKETDTEEAAYLKLEGLEIIDNETKSPFLRFVKTFPVTLSSTAASSASPSVLYFPSLVEDLTLDFNSETGHVELKGNCTRVTITLNGVLCTSLPMIIKPKSAIQIGSVYFYALFPEFEKPVKTYAELSLDVLQSSKNETLSCREIAFAVIQHVDYYHARFGNAEGLLSLSKAIQGPISKHDKIQTVNLGRRVYYKLKT